MRHTCCGSLLTLALLAVLPRPAAACTAFAIQRGAEVVIGKNYDWDLGQGLVIRNPRGIGKQALPGRPGDRPAKWVSRHASLTFNQYGRELANGGLNDAGLVVEVLWLDESVDPPPDERPTVSELQLVQYLLDTSATTAEAVAAARGVRVSRVHGKIHYFVCDRGGACAVLEHVGGRLVVATGPGPGLPVRTLANDTYARSLAALRTHQGFGGSQPIPPGRGSLARFVRASALAAAAGRDATAGLVAAAFAALESTAQGAYTKWRIVYEPAAGRVHFRTVAQPTPATVAVAQLPGECPAPALVLDIDAAPRGDVTARFVPYTEAHNERLVRATLGPLAPRLPPGVIDEVVRYPGRLPCTLAAGTGGLPPYPERWIREAQAERRNASCYHLIYKRGCAEKRTGRLTVAITLDEEGRVRAAQTVGNTVGRDPALVERCVHQALRAWRFPPPAGYLPRFEMTLIFADKC
jgi:choloylglycine hydrolase